MCTKLSTQYIGEQKCYYVTEPFLDPENYLAGLQEGGTCLVVGTGHWCKWHMGQWDGTIVLKKWNLMLVPAFPRTVLAGPKMTSDCSRSQIALEAKKTSALT